MTLFIKILFKNSYLFLKNKNYREFLWLVFRYGDTQRYKSKKINFLNYKFTVPDLLSFIWQFKEIFVDEFYYFQSPSGSPVILDCGANIGSSCIYFKQIYPKAKITAFEADPSIAKILHNNLSSNNINDIEIINKAVWIDNSGVELSPEGSDGASIYGEGAKIKIESVRLKEYLQNTKIDMLKMDIEGAEIEVIRDCKEVLVNVQNLFVEYHSFKGKQQELNELLNILTQNNFRYTIHSPHNSPRPLIAVRDKTGNGMDLQLNIFAYKSGAFQS